MEGGDDEGGVTDTTIDSTSNNNYSFGYDRGVDDGCIDFTNNGGGIMGLDINDTDKDEEINNITSGSATKLAASQDTRESTNVSPTLVTEFPTDCPTSNESSPTDDNTSDNVPTITTPTPTLAQFQLYTPPTPEKKKKVVSRTGVVPRFSSQSSAFSPSRRLDFSLSNDDDAVSSHSSQHQTSTDPLEVAAVAYNNDPIFLNDGNKKLFRIHNKRQLYRITVLLPSITDQISLGIRLQHNIRFGRAVITSISNTSSLFDQIPTVFHNGYILVAVEVDEESCQSSDIKKFAKIMNVF